MVKGGSMFYPSVINKKLNKPVKRKIIKIIIIYNDIFPVMINKKPWLP